MLLPISASLSHPSLVLLTVKIQINLGTQSHYRINSKWIDI